MNTTDINQAQSILAQLETSALETKVHEPANPSAPNGALDHIHSAFEEYKATNDLRLAEIENKRSADVLLEEKLARINQSLDEQQERLHLVTRKSGRPGLEQRARKTQHSREYSASFERYVRSGAIGQDSSLSRKNLTSDVPRQGGYLVPDGLDVEIATRLQELPGLRSISSVQTISGSELRLPYAETRPGAVWTQETTTRAQTDSPALNENVITTKEIYAMPAASATLLDDAAIDIEGWLADEIESMFSRAENEAFVKGSGNTQPKGFLQYPKTTGSSRPTGSIEEVTTGADGAFPSSEPADPIIELIYRLESGYRQNATIVMNRKTMAEVRKLKDGDGRYLWQVPSTGEATSRVLGYSVLELEYMPDIGANSSSIAIGDFKKGYQIVDRRGIQVLRDPYSQKPFVLFYVTKRVGGGCKDFDAIKFLTFKS